MVTMKSAFCKIPIVFLLLWIGVAAGNFEPGFKSRQVYLASSKPAQSIQFQDVAAAADIPADTEKSLNWAGYIATPVSGKSYTSISGNWTVPDITAGQKNALAGQWIGLGGVSSTDLLQIGTLEIMENGQATAEVFWEKLLTDGLGAGELNL